MIEESLRVLKRKIIIARIRCESKNCLLGSDVKDVLMMGKEKKSVPYKTPLVFEVYFRFLQKNFPLSKTDSKKGGSFYFLIS